MKRLLFLLLWLIAALPAHALESAAVVSKRVTATLVSETDAIQPNVPFRVGLRLKMAEGWHTYWKNPGDAGVPTELMVDGTSPGASPIEWPMPRRISEGPIMTYAYTGEVLLPMTVKSTDGIIKAHAEWLVCKDICVPEEGDFTLNLATGTPAPSPQAPLFAEHDREVPRTSPWTATIATNGTLFVQGPELTPSSVTDASFIPDRSDQIQDDAAQPLTVREGGFTLALKLAKNFDAAKGLSGVLSVRDRAGLQTDVEMRAAVGPAPGPASPPLGQILVFAFLGGLILNLMPCVFPILAVKAVLLAKHAGTGHRGRGHGHAVSYTAGVLVTFVALAAALLAARAAGVAAGWGFQFSSPVFVAGMAWLLFAIGLNLSGVYEVGGSLMSVGGGLPQRGGAIGSFMTGLLAVLVATPCTAPFMGVAVAAGLAAPPPITVAVFVAMGLGMAAPYVALASMPWLAALMPRPGRWMEMFKQILAFPMYGAAAWLTWVVSVESGADGVLATVTGLVLVAFAAWLYGVTQMADTQPRRFAQAACFVAILAAAAVLSRITPAPATPAPAATSSEAYKPERLAALRSAGKPVFVDMTAAWCVTCLVNERVAISTDAVRQEFAARGITYMIGDWTRQDATITAFLRQYGRDGVPLYVFFPAKNGEPEVLPQILTEGEVLRTLR